MRIRSVRLVDFRGVADCRVEFGPGVTVVEGPNEVGKSSIAEALRLIRDSKATSGAREIRLVQPVGRDVGPEVTVDLTTGDYDLQYRKRWLRRPETELHVRSPRPEDLSGDAAHDRFRAILDETLDLDLLVALEVQQGQSLTQPELARIPALRRTLGGAGGSGAHEVGSESGSPAINATDHDDLMAAIEAEYLRFFTPGGKPTGGYRQALQELEAARSTLVDLEEQGRQLDAFVDRRDRLDAVVDDLVGKLEAAREDLRAQEQADHDLQDRREAVEQLTRGLAEADLRLARAREAQETRRALVEDIGKRTLALVGVTDHVTSLEAQRVAAETASREADEALGTAEQADVTARRAVRSSEDALGRRRDERDLLALRARVAGAREARERLHSAKSELDGLRVDQDTATRLATLENAVTLASRSRDVAAALVTVTSLGDQPVMAGGEQVPAGGQVASRVHDSLTIEAPGVLRVDIHPGETPGELDRALSQARSDLRAALDRAGVATVEEANDLARRRSAVEAAATRAEEDLLRALAGEELDALEQHLSDLQTRVGGGADAPDGDDSPDGNETTAPPSSMEDLQRAVRDAQDQEERTGRELDAAREAADRARSSRESATQEALLAGAQSESAGRELARLQGDLDAARARADDETLDRELSAATRDHQAHRERQEAARKALDAADPETVEMLLGNARDLVTSTEDDLQATRQECAKLDGLIEDRLASGIGSAREEAAARTTAAEQRSEQFTRDAEAAELLRQTMVRQRDLAQQRYVAPFTERIRRLGRVVFGRDFAVTISPGLEIESRTSGGRTVPFASLSAGTREQLALIGRLACAQLVAADEGAPVILDDTLGFSDPERLRAIAAVLGSVGTSTQVIVLTCQPGRFAGIGGAHVVRLDRADLSGVPVSG